MGTYTRRLKYSAALTTAFVVVSAGAASAHHCYKDQWAEAAYQHHVAGGTAWVSLSDVAMMFLIPPELQETCGWAADTGVADYMEAHDLTQEPLIHSRAVVGGGAEKNGKNPAPFSYLVEADFMELETAINGYLEVCTAP